MANLLNPENLQGHYIHQLKQTIHAYSSTQIVFGEALQNAIDAVVETGGGNHVIRLHIDFGGRRIAVADTGVGFPNDPKLLFLGGSNKQQGGRKKIFGLVGVGIKVVLFRSDMFTIRSRRGDGTCRFEITNAHQFDREPPPDLTVPDIFAPDPTPLETAGTEIAYTFPAGTPLDPIRGFLDELMELCLPSGVDSGLGTTLADATANGFFDCRFSGLIASFLRRYTYAGDVLNRLGGKPELANTTIRVTGTCQQPDALPDNIRTLWDGRTDFSVEVEPSYLLMEDTVGWVPAPKPGSYAEQLGRGGTNLARTAHGYNQLVFAGAEEFERLLTRANGQVEGSVDEYRRRLFPRLNGIILTIARIPHLQTFLPAGGRRVISANGVATSHDIDLTSGRNQEYVRCFDLVTDVDADLNYGKSQLTDKHLVNLVRRFVNDAYRSTIQTAAGNWVGRVDVEEPEYDVFLARPDIGVPGLVLQKEPRDENDVIALFFELAAREVLTGYRILGLSQRDQYDARGLIQRQAEPGPRPMPPDDRQLDVVEFKVVASSLVADLERGSKNAGDIRLVVAWDEGRSDSPRFAFADIRHARCYPDDAFPGVERYLEDTRSAAQIQVLLLRRIVQRLQAQGQ